MGNLFKVTLLAAAVMGLAACGGSDDNNFFNSSSRCDNGGYFGCGSANGGSDTAASGDAAATTGDTNAFVKMIQNSNGSALVGGLDITNGDQQKGFIDYALDAFGNGPLQIAIDAKKLFDKDKGEFTFLPGGCTVKGESGESKIDCYTLIGNEIHKLGTQYDGWNFDDLSNDAGLNGMEYSKKDDFKGDPLHVTIFYTGKTNQPYNHIILRGAYSYPFQQRLISGSTESTQTRYVRVGDKATTTDNFDINKAISGENEDETYTIQQDSNFTVLTNTDKLYSHANATKMTVTAAEGATYTIKTDKTEELNFAKVSIEQQGTNLQTGSKLEGSLYYKFTPTAANQTIFSFVKAAGASLTFDHKLLSVIDGKTTYSNINLTGTAQNTDGKVIVNLTSPESKTLSY